MLQLRNITKTYRTGSNKIVALDNVSLDFPEKGLVFIVGKSGSGKSTLLNILGGLDKMDSGDIIINGKSTHDFSSSDFDAYRNYHIGFIFQEFNLIDDMSVKDNIAIALKIQSKGHDLTTIDEALKLVNLEGLGYRSPKELSGGQKQRIAVARALVKNPDIILADEPTGALDSKTGFDLMSSLKSLSENKLVIVVTHDDEFANVFGDEIIHLTDGHIIDHLVISPEYKIPVVEKITDNIIKIPSGCKINDKSIIDNSLKENNSNYICLTTSPELLTIAYPDSYDAVFEKEDLSKKFVSKSTVLSEIVKSKDKKSNQKAKIKFSECFKMAIQQFKKSKKKTVFLLLFTIISISVLGFTYSLSSVDNSKITANTLINNNIELGMMQKEDEYGIISLASSEVDKLNEKFKSQNFAIAKEVQLDYKSGNYRTESAFELGSFTGVVECDDVTKLNLNIIEGIGTFNNKSLQNNEIIISDYAAFELRRTGYMGLDKDLKYGLIQPETLTEQINTYINIEDINYKIVGVFDTNFEDYLHLLVSESAIEKDDSSYLSALKSYYYARIFGPRGFYKEHQIKTGNADQAATFTLETKAVPIYTYNPDTDSTSNRKILRNFEYSGFNNFYSFDDIKDKLSGHYDVLYGSIPEQLSSNQVVISYDWLKLEGLAYTAQIEKAIETFNTNTSIYKTSSTAEEKPIFSSSKEQLEVVAVIDIEDDLAFDDSLLVKDYYSQIAMFFSNEFSSRFAQSIYDYDQVLFTLSGGRALYTSTINKMEKEGYTVVNMDGQETLSDEDITTFKTIAAIVALIMLAFSFLIMINFVSGSVKSREKEIGILRATGARRRDIIKIFAVEEGILALIVSIIGLVIVAYACSLINKYLGNVELGIQLLVFDLTSVFVILLGTFAFFAITTLIPISSIINKKPIDAIRKG